MATRMLWLALLVLGAPAALAQDDDWDDDWDDEAALPVELHGVVEVGTASRLVDDATQPGDFVMNEARFRLDLEHLTDRADLRFEGDVIADEVTERIDLDIRQALVALQPGSAVALRLGRQVMTWGTGDLLFLNDLFPKDFVAFFIGRDDEFLKAPANAVRATVYNPVANLDVAWMPRFTPDRTLTGERLSFFDPISGQRVGTETLDAPIDPLRPDATLGHGEVAVRVYRTLGSVEAALYGYTGFTKQPLAFDATTGTPTYAPLSVLGASLRGELAGGISQAEVAYYDSRDDRDGTDPFTPNSQLRGLVGHERELATNLTLGVQYYLEHTRDHDALIAGSFAPEVEPSETRHVVTSRWTYLLRQQTVVLSLFAFVSPNDGDGYVRPFVQHQWSDAVTFTLGGNLFFGAAPTFFGQLADNTNAYARVRYSF
ncbi:MAG: hypothetical protein AAFQ53_14630 [Bacteroidota bacterium]